MTRPNLQLDDDISQADDISSMAPSSVVGGARMHGLNHMSMKPPDTGKKSPLRHLNQGFGDRSGRVSPLTRAAMNRMT